MAKPAFGEKVDKSADEHEGGVDKPADEHEGGAIIAVFPTSDGNFRYVLEKEGYGALQFFDEENLVNHCANLM
jgi:hypothetical protein